MEAIHEGAMESKRLLNETTMSQAKFSPNAAKSTRANTTSEKYFMMLTDPSYGAGHSI
jgi:hypothetical protein